MKEAIDQNLLQNEFEELENDSTECQILQLELKATLFLNVACYY